MRIVVLAGLLAMVGCADLADDPAPTESAVATEPSATEAAQSVETEAPPTRLQLTLTPDGLMRAPQGGEPPRLLAFGTSRATVESLAERAIGAATERSRNEECGAGAMEFTEFGALTLNFQDGEFVGWFADEGTQVPITGGFVSGITRVDLESGGSVTMIPETTLEGEFEYVSRSGEAFGGFLDGTGADSRVVAFYAGTNCFFR